MHAAPKRRPTGFTLVEMLVVITIIGILASLAIPAVFSAIVTAKEARIAIEISELDRAMVSYKVNQHAYPPDFSNPALNVARINIHLLRRFPRRIATDVPMGIDLTTGNAVSADIARLDPAEALIFWLRGFSPDPQRPLSGNNRKPLFEFTQSRLVDLDNDGWPEYVPQDGNGAPYVYFNANTYLQQPAGTPAFYSTSTVPGRATPHVSDFGTANERYVNAKTCQIISAGLDGDYGGSDVFSYPSGVGSSGGTYLKPDRDNITNFSGGTLGDRQEEAE